MPVWGYRYLSSIEAQSREISHRHAACPTGAGDFSTLVEMTTGRGALVTFMGLFHSGVRFLHFGRNDSGAGNTFDIHGVVPFRREISPLRFAAVEMTAGQGGIGAICSLSS